MKVEKNYNICIVGGGASGLVAAIAAKDLNPEASIVILEKLEEPGKKVAAAGNGRCNLSNVEAENWEATSGFFYSLGLITKADDQGRIYPYSEDGRDVVSILVESCNKRGIQIVTRRQVTRVENKDGSFELEGIFNKPKAYREKQEDGPLIIKGDRVLISTGGNSKPKLGTTGDGYKLAKDLGHSINTLVPVLTAIETEEKVGDLGISGIREKARVTLLEGDKILFREEGEVQFTDYGISGICIFDMSRFISGLDYSKYKISIDFAPDINQENLESIIRDKEGEISSIVKAPLARVMEKMWRAADSQGDESKGKAVLLKNFCLQPKGLKGWDMAQVTRGGIPLEEINKETGESLLVPGLYFSGEMLDLDYKCGGFNLQNAWTTGILAGKSMAMSLTSK